MKYADLAKTFNMLAEHGAGSVVMDWAEHDEWGIELSGFNLSPAEIRMLAEMGWGLGSDNEYDEDGMQAWLHPESHTDEEIVDVFNDYKSIYKYA